MARTVLDEVLGVRVDIGVHPSPVWRVPATMRVVGAGAGPAVDGVKRMLGLLRPVRRRARPSARQPARH